MLTYLPMYFQTGLRYAPQGAGLLMLPMAVPLFFVPRLVAAHLTHRYSGRALLTAGLVFVAAGMAWMAIEAPRFDYVSMLGGMLLAGIGAGLLNGESAKVGMTVIPPQRAGMASGIGGTLRFTGIVVGFAVLGAILFARVSSTVDAGLMGDAAPDRAALVHSIAAGDLSGAGFNSASQAALRELALRSFGNGYQAIMFAAAIFAALSAILTWLLVHPAETAPLPRTAKAPTAAVAPVE
jgi:fucose permease